MAACSTTYLEAGRSWEARAEERNAGLMALQAQRRRGVRTPEVLFVKQFDNSRLVKTPDPARTRQVSAFSIVSAILLSLIMFYGMQHVSSIEGGYKVESEKQMLDQLREENRQLRLSQAQLTEPDRIDKMAREMGLVEPQPGQMVHPAAATDVSTPVLAQAAPQTSLVQ
jgi:cell division protein FtsL